MQSAFGTLLVVLGIVALVVPMLTFFTVERVADAGFFAIDVQRPHTIIINPMVGIIALVGGIVLLAFAAGTKSPTA